jgi:hypothetical protein
MSCPWVFVFIIGTLVLTALVSGLLFAYQYRNSPEKCWQVRVFNVASAARRQIQAETTNLRRLGPDQEAAARALKDEAFCSYLAGISINELDAYSGIGPATIAKLQGAGYANLASLRHARVHIHGLGEKRLADVNLATRDLSQKAQREFDGGASPQAAALGTKLRELSADYARQEILTRARMQAAEKVSKSLEKLEAAAGAVTFWRWLRPRLAGKGDPPELMDEPLPNLEAALHDAEAEAARTWKVNNHEIPTKQRTAIKKAQPAPPSAVKKEPVSPARVADPVHAPLPELVNETPDDTRLLLMELTIQFCLAAARADGPVTSHERDLIRGHIRQRFGYDRALLNRAENLCTHYQSAAIDLDHCLRQIKEKVAVSDLTALVEFASTIIATSGGGDKAGKAFLKSAASRLGVAEPSVAPPLLPRAAKSPPAVSPPAVPTQAECLALLEIAPGASPSAGLVRRQWALLSERMAPEKAARMGPEFLKVAEKQQAVVRQAAEMLLESMGEKLEVTPPASPPQELRHNPDLDDVFGGM